MRPAIKSWFPGPGDLSLCHRTHSYINMTTALLHLANVCKAYRVGPISTEVLRDVCLDVNEGDLLSIMGPSGSGKSTLMNIIGLLDQPTSGSYLMRGQEVGKMDDDELSNIRNATIGFVFQSFHLLPQLTAVENVGLPLTYRGLDADASGHRSREALARVGLTDRSAHKPNELSGGQQQRVAIARALVGRPAIMLADEPTGALDPRIGQEIMELFRELNADEGLTIIIITHDSKIAGQCGRHTRIENGTLIQEGP